MIDHIKNTDSRLISGDLLLRYAPGGDIFKALSEKYGYPAAMNIYRAARTRWKWKITEALVVEKFGGYLPT